VAPVEIDEESFTFDQNKFYQEIDSPHGYNMFYSMSFSLEKELHVSEASNKGRKVVSRMPVPLQNPDPFSKGALDELMLAAQTVMLGKTYNKLDQYKKYEKELTQSAPYSLRVYVLA
jgi:hypothetical protein